MTTGLLGFKIDNIVPDGTEIRAQHRQSNPGLLLSAMNLPICNSQKGSRGWIWLDVISNPMAVMFTPQLQSRGDSLNCRVATIDALVQSEYSRHASAIAVQILVDRRQSSGWG